MFSKIVVAHDHLAGGQDALALARVMARPTGAELVLAGVIPIGMMPAEAELVWKDEEREFAERIRESADEAEGEARVFHSHSVARGLSDLAGEIGADLIVIGSSRRGKVGRIVAGDIALQVLHGAHCAVAVAPVGYAEQSHQGLESLVVGVDGEPEAQAAARAAAELAGATGAGATLVGVVQPPTRLYGKGGGMAGAGELEAAIREQVQEGLDQAASGFSEGAQVEQRLVEGDASEQLRSAAEGASLLIVGSRGHGPLGRILLGSTDAALLDDVQAPMLVWPRRAKDAG